MGKETFAARMALLARQGYPVIALDIAVAALPTGQWPRGATIVTIDDGWFGTYRQMAPVLRAHGFPALLYIASYYLDKQTQIGRASCRESVSVRVDLGGRRIIKKKTITNKYKISVITTNNMITSEVQHTQTTEYKKR